MELLQCRKHSSSTHDVFINYRVASEKELAMKLFYALSLFKHPTSGLDLKIFLDRQCLPDGEEYEKHFVTGIKNSTIILLLISDAAIANISNADQWQDNVLLEYEFALEQHESDNAFVLPLLIPTLKVVEGETFISKFKKFGTDVYPDAPHKSPKSNHTVRGTMKKLFALQGVHIDLDNLDASLPNIIEKIPLTESKRLDKYLNGPDGEIKINLGGREVSLYKYQKGFYITLAYPNFFQFKNPTRAVGNDQVAIFSKIRYDPIKSLVKVDDATFAYNLGQIFNHKIKEPMKYGSCGGCEKDNFADGIGRIDLRGTPFAVNDTFVPKGWKAVGTAKFSSDNQVVDLSGGGYCGECVPASLKEKELADIGGWAIKLKII